LSIGIYGTLGYITVHEERIACDFVCFGHGWSRQSRCINETVSTKPLSFERSDLGK
jgi:hypothetical protein